VRALRVTVPPAAPPKITVFLVLGVRPVGQAIAVPLSVRLVVKKAFVEFHVPVPPLRVPLFAGVPGSQ
jgi:hypothetical protein